MGWLLGKIFGFIGDLLGKVFSAVFKLFEPVLVNVLWPLAKMILGFILDIFAGVFYQLLAAILRIVDAIQVAFNVFCGLKTVALKDNPKAEFSLLTALFTQKGIQTAIAAVTVVAIVLTILFAGVAVLRSMSDISGGQNSRPVSRVLNMTFRAMLRFFMIPMISLGLLLLSDAVLLSISNAFNTKQNTVANIIFVSCTMDAAKRTEYNAHVFKDEGGEKVKTGQLNTSREVGLDDEIRKPFYDGTKKYYDEDAVKGTFELKWLDFITGFFGALFMLIVLGMCCFSFICRIFDVLLLLLASPFFIATMPLDDGEKYKTWQDMFIGKLFGGYGMVMAMQLYLIVCPLIMGNSIQLTSGGGEMSGEVEILMRLLFLLGGAWAVLQSGPMVTSLISERTGQLETAQNNFSYGAVKGGAMAVGTTALATAKFSGKLVGKTLGLPFGSDKVDNKAAGDGFGKPSPEKGQLGFSEDTGEGSGSDSGSGSLGFKGESEGGAQPGKGTGPAAGSTGKSTGPAGKGAAPGGAPAAGGEGAGSGGGPAAGGEGAGSGGGHAAGGEGAGPDGAGQASAGGEGAGLDGLGQAPAGEGDGQFTDNPPAAEGGQEGEGQNQGQEGQGQSQEGQGQSQEGGKTPEGEGGEQQFAGKKEGEGADGKEGEKKDDPKKNAAGGRLTGSYLGGLFTRFKDSNGKMHTGFNFGFIKRGYDKNGNYSFKILGIGKEKNKKGSAISIFGWKAKKMGADGVTSINFLGQRWSKAPGSKGYSLSKLNLGVVQFKKSKKYDAQGNVTGLSNTYCSGIPIIGMKKKYNQLSGKAETISMMGAHFSYKKDKDGQLSRKVESVKPLGVKLYQREQSPEEKQQKNDSQNDNKNGSKNSSKNSSKK